MNNLEKLINLTFNRIKERLNSGDTIIEQYFETPETENITLFTIKQNSTGKDGDLTFTIGSCRKDTDVLFSNYIFTGSKFQIIDFINKEENFSKICEYVKDLALKTDKYWSEEDNDG